MRRIAIGTAFLQLAKPLTWDLVNSGFARLKRNRARTACQEEHKANKTYRHFYRPSRLSIVVTGIATCARFRCGVIVNWRNIAVTLTDQRSKRVIAWFTPVCPYNHPLECFSYQNLNPLRKTISQ